MIDPKDKEWIDKASYGQLLFRWRHAPTGDMIFQGKIGDYYSNVMDRRRGELQNNTITSISKKVGWTQTK